jgi:group II intron reverse transcriptase/maturase
MVSTEHQYSTETRLKRISWLSAADPAKKFGILMHHFNEESLKVCFRELDGKKALGVDGVDKDSYAKDLDTNIPDLLDRMRRMACRPGPVRQVMIPKEGKPGATRPLGISNVEERSCKRVTRKVLESIYEPLFLPCSYGFRPGLGCHDAIKALHRHLFHGKVETVIDIDLADFFGSIDHRMLLAILQENIADERFMRYIVRMFKAGVLAASEMTVSEEGVPQGSICSPVLANVMAHYVIDVWFAETVKTHCRGQVEIFRYCDDFVICCECRDDAERIRTALSGRLNKFGLRLNEAKTQLVPFFIAALFDDPLLDVLSSLSPLGVDLFLGFPHELAIHLFGQCVGGLDHVGLGIIAEDEADKPDARGSV